jgi:hypothetical protein
MVDNQKNKEKAKTNVMWVCPSCGKTVHIRRKYCVCHTDLGRAKVRVSEEPPEIKQCNFEAEGLHCGDCPEDCMYCASFGFPRTNNAGFGGKDCRYKSDKARCYCCQAQVKLAIKLGEVNFSEIIGGVLEKKEGAENLYFKAAGFIHDEMVKPVLARINRERERAG